MELTPITHDVIEGAVVEAFYALICAWLGMTDDAISSDRTFTHHAVCRRL